jgi:hypothetical protein
LLVIAVRIGRTSVDRLQFHAILVPAKQHLLVRRAVHALSGYFRYPAAQFGIEIGEAAGLSTLQAAQEIPSYVLHPRFDLAFGTGRQMHLIGVHRDHLSG